MKLYKDGAEYKMSKRAGTFVTLRDVVDEVGRDPVRFMMLYRKNDAPLDFDFAKVTEQSKDNPVFYVQYAHARAGLTAMQEAFPGLGETSDEVLKGTSRSSITRKGKSIRQEAGGVLAAGLGRGRRARAASRRSTSLRYSARRSTRSGREAMNRHIYALSDRRIEVTAARLALVSRHPPGDFRFKDTASRPRMRCARVVVTVAIQG